VVDPDSTGGFVEVLGIMFGPAMAIIAVVAMFLAGALLWLRGTTAIQGLQ